MRVNVAWSTEKNSLEAGKQSAKKAVLDLVQTKIAFIFSSQKYDQAKLIQGVKEKIGSAPIIGSTSSNGIITQGGLITSENGFVGIMAIGDSDTAVGTAGLQRQITALETGEMVAKIAMKKIGTSNSPSYFYMICSPGEEEEYLKGIQNVIGDVPCFGGTCSDEDFTGNWSIFTEDSQFTDGVAVAFFYTNKYLPNVFSGKYHETINSGIITKVNNSRQLQEIENVQALKKYEEWVDKKNKDLAGIRLMVNSIYKPIGVKTPNGEIVLIRHPLSGNKDFSITIGNNASVNTGIIQMLTTKEEIISQTGLFLRDLNKEIQVKEKEAAGYILVYDSIRKMAIEDDVDNVIKNIKKETGNKPFIMPFTFGEYGRGKHTGNLCGGLMMSYIAFCK